MICSIPQGFERFIKDIKEELNKEIREKTKERLTEHWRFGIHSSSDRNEDYFELNWNYCGQQNNFSGTMGISKKERDTLLTIDRYLGIGVHSNSNWASPASLPEELRIAADISDQIKELIEKRFGKPISEHDGRAIYQGKLEEKYFVR